MATAVTSCDVVYGGHRVGLVVVFLAGCFECCHLLGLFGGLDGPDSGLGECLEAHVAAGDRPFVVLLSQQGADEADDRWPGGEDAHDVGAASDLFVKTFLGVVGPDLAPVGLGNPVNAKISLPAASRCSAASTSPASKRWSTTRRCCAHTSFADGWAKIVRTIVATID
jgi:hypothetical protein